MSHRANTAPAPKIARRLLLVFALATGLNYPWELAQTPFYAGVEFPRAAWHCFVSALGDGLLVLGIYAATAVTTRDSAWYMHPRPRSYVAMAIAGLVLGFAVEWWGVSVAKRWQYSELMPVIPGAGVGAVPVLQMLVLPPVVFWLMRRL